MRTQRGYIDLGGFFVLMALVCIAIGVGLAWGIPWLWSLIKPLIHAATA